MLVTLLLHYSIYLLNCCEGRSYNTHSWRFSIFYIFFGETEYQVPGINNHIVRLVHSQKPYCKWNIESARRTNWTCLMYHAACKVEFSTVQSVVLTADVFQLFIKYHDHDRATCFGVKYLNSNSARSWKFFRFFFVPESWKLIKLKNKGKKKRKAESWK